MSAKKGFTLAELMLVFTVIGVLAAILIPALSSVIPDQKEIKAKKAYNSFSRAVDDLINKGVYAEQGKNLDAGNFFENAYSNEALSFFCTNLADVMNVKSSNCLGNNNAQTGYVYYPEGILSDQLTESDEYAWIDIRPNITTKIPGKDKVSSVNLVGEACAERNDENVCIKWLRSDEIIPNIDFSVLQGIDSLSFDGICAQYFGSGAYMSTTSPVLEGADPVDAYSFITADNIGWVVRKTKFDYNSSVFSFSGIETGISYSPICINVGDLRNINLDDIYGMGINSLGHIVPGGKLQALIDEQMEN